MGKYLFIAAAVLISSALNGQAKQARSDSHCDAPGYFGICDPYVPGTIISFPEKQPIRVVTTWHDGPAEKAGVCPGDQIVAVNGVVAAENTSHRMLHEVVSAKPSPVALTIKRGDQTLEFRVRRVRESKLAALSHQRFLSDPVFWGSSQLVPHGEKHTEYTHYVGFLEQLEKQEGFTRVDGVGVPVGTSSEQVKRIKEFSISGARQARIAGFIGPTSGKHSFGFSTLVLKDGSNAMIEEVLPNSPAHRAGLLPGDDLLELDGQEISGLAFAEVKALIVGRDEERTINLQVSRGGERRTYALQSEPWDQIWAADLRNALKTPSHPFSPDNYILGIEVLYLPDPRAVMVSAVDWPSPAFDAGLHVGDSILAIDGKPLSEIDRDALSKLLVPEGAAAVTFEVSRLGRKRIFTVTPVTARAAEAAIGRKPAKSGFMPASCPAS